MRRERAENRKRTRAYLDLCEEVDQLTDAEFEELIADYTPQEQERLHFLFKPTKQQNKDFYKMLKHPNKYLF